MQAASQKVPVIRQAVRSTSKWAALLCLEGQLDTLLTMAHRESAFNPVLVGDDGKSLFLFQTMRADMKMLRKFWRSRGYELGSDRAVDTQCAFGVAEFYLKLKRWDGNLWLGVRSYNGGGPGARRYALRVMASRAIIFGRRPVVGETVDMECSR